MIQLAGREARGPESLLHRALEWRRHVGRVEPHALHGPALVIYIKRVLGLVQAPNPIAAGTVRRS